MSKYGMSKYDELSGLRHKCLMCRKCSIGGQVVDDQYLSNVFSNMNADAKYMVVGQNPGRDELRLQEPFVGISGKMFNKVVEEAIGMSRTDFYISNTCRCFTPENRKPTTQELDNCRGFLDEEIKIIKPKLIIALGGPSLLQLTGLNGIMKHHGNITFSPRYHVNVFPLLHPSPLNLNNPKKKALFVADLLKFKKFVDLMTEMEKECQM